MTTVDRVRTFACPVCGSAVFFENTSCLTCGTDLGYDRGRRSFVALSAPVTHDLLDAVWDEGADPAVVTRRVTALTLAGRACVNRTLIDCNWVAGAAGELCGSCALTRTRPADDDPDAMIAFARTERAKRRLVYELDDLGLPTRPGLTFDLLSSRDGPVTTGHADGVITINLAEGDDGYREHLRVQLAEPYRTLLGHLRHETGHWYWEILVDGSSWLPRFRDLFGDERADYTHALEQHYGVPASGIRADEWADEHVSHYAAAHPWEDWAESFAHYLHLRDTVQTAAANGVRVHDTTAIVESDDFDALIAEWLPLTIVLNSLNRSMGKDDLYPFVLRPRVLDKLRFVHDVVSAA